MNTLKLIYSAQKGDSFCFKVKTKSHFHLTSPHLISNINLFLSHDRYDYLSIKNEDNQDFGKYCGVLSGQSVKVAGDYVNISFHSDDSVNRRGYNMSFSTVPQVGKYSEHYEILVSNSHLKYKFRACSR